ncbi:MAG: WYL domain-containing protein, partial [Pseudomonadota bacterium]
EVEPLGLVLKAGIWYMAARAGARAEPRTYRLSNIRALKVLDQHFKPPRDFNLATWWHASTRRFETGVYRDTAQLRASARGLRLLREFSAAVADAVDKTTEKDSKAGWSRVTVPIESVEHAADQLINLGADVEALTPPALRARLRLTAKRLTRLYGTVRPPSPARRSAPR